MEPRPKEVIAVAARQRSMYQRCGLESESAILRLATYLH